MKKTSFCIILAISFFATVSAQDTARNYFFNEIGWSVSLPPGFKVLDATEDKKNNERGLKAMEESNGITADLSKMKTLISASKDPQNYFNATIRTYDVLKEGPYDSTTGVLDNMVYKTISDKIPTAKLDSVTTIVLIDGISFNKFQLIISLRANFTMHMFILSKYYKGYDFGITYLYIDETTRGEIESMLNKSKFIK
jgi:hypothetical protein